jgi:hypothetical protein
MANNDFLMVAESYLEMKIDMGTLLLLIMLADGYVGSRQRYVLEKITETMGREINFTYTEDTPHLQDKL